MLISPKSRLGTYEILGPVGAGGMGEVYRAKDLRLGREIAVKVLPAEVASSPDRLARFEREARIVAGLNHPNIVTLFSVEDEGGVHFLTMELVEGRSLADIITTGGLPLSDILDLSIPLADALSVAHGRGVVHRDLKPGNVMLTGDGRVKVLDFGLAKMTSGQVAAQDETVTAAADALITETGQVMGTLPYMAPEQVRGESTDARSDLFAFGVILYELAAGRRPFDGATSADVTSAILRDTPEPLASVRPDLPRDMDRIVSRCLEKKLRDRVQTALDVCNELRRVKHTFEHEERPRHPMPTAQFVASIAVLPFVNRSRDEEDEYFSDGLADQLLNMLAKIRGLRVVARTSSFTFRHKEATIGEVGRALNVSTVLEGSVRKAGSRVRITVQLVNVANGCHIWSETYDRTLEDIFAVQDDIARSVVKEMRATLLGKKADAGALGDVEAEVAMATRGRGQSAEAHRIYLQARYFVERYTREDVAKGTVYLRKALQMDARNALARAELARAYSREADVGWVPAGEGYSRARKEVARALLQEPDLAEGHTQMGHIQMLYDWDWQGAEASFRRALECAPGNALALRQAGALALTQGRLDEAIGFYRRALEQDPLSSAAYHNLGWALHEADRFEEAEGAYRRALDLVPQRFLTRANLSLILLIHGRDKEALAEAMREPEEAYRLWALTIIHHSAGRLAESDEALRRLVEKEAATAAYQIAELYAVREVSDAAFEWLERAYVQRDGGLTALKTNARFRSLHDDPRWGAFLKKMGLED